MSYRGIENKVREHENKLANIGSVTGVGDNYSKLININDWTGVEGNYQFTLNHNLNNENFVINMVDVLLKEPIQPNYKIIDKNSILFKSNAKRDIRVILNLGSGVTDIKDEITNSRVDFNGKTNKDLSERLNSDMNYVSDRFNNASLLEYEDKYISASESYDGFTKELQIKGRTLQNFLKKPFMDTKGTEWAPSNSGILDEVTYSGKKCLKITSTTSDAHIYQCVNLKPNTKYTISFTSYIPEGVLCVGIRTWESTAGGWISCGKGNVFNDNIRNAWRTDTYTFTTPATANIKGMVIAIGFSDPTTGKSIYACEGILVEGELSEGQRCFEGITSANPTAIKSCGKNLIKNGNCEIDDFSMWRPKNEVQGATIAKNINGGFIFTSSNAFRGVWQQVKVKQNTDYYVHGLFDSTKLQLNIRKGSDSNQVIKLSDNKLGWFNTGIENMIYVLIESIVAVTNEPISNIQLEEGMIATPYEPYKEDEITLPTITDELKGLPNGAKDELDIEKGKLIRRVGKIVLNGSEGFTKSLNDYGSCIRFDLVLSDLATGNPLNKLICDKLICRYTTREDGEEGITTNTGNYLVIFILKSKLTTQDVAGFKAWLQANPVTVYYELEIPIETLLDLPNSLRTYDKKTNIFTQVSTIVPNIYCKVPSNVVTALDTRQSTVKGKLFGSADSRLEEIEQDVKNIVTQEPWITPTLTNGWVDANPPYNITKYYKDSLGIVRLKGRLKSGTINQPFFTLPLGYRPSESLIFPINSNGAYSICIINANGQVIVSVGSNIFISLDNISFKAE